MCPAWELGRGRGGAGEVRCRSGEPATRLTLPERVSERLPNIAKHPRAFGCVVSAGVPAFVVQAASAKAEEMLGDRPGSRLSP
jgi:hypothetical protein